MGINKYFIEQHDSNDCGVAALAMVCKYYGKDFTITKIRDLLGTDVQGTTVKGLYNGASALGFSGKVIRLTEDVIFEKGITLPAICHVRTAEGASHFIVLFSNKKNKLVCLDPAKSKVIYTAEEFFKISDGVVLFLYPTHIFENLKSDKASTFKIFSEYVFREKKLFVCSFIASIVLTLLGILYSLFNKVLMDEVLPYALTDMLLAYSIGFGVVLIARLILSAVRNQIVLFLSQRIELPLLTGYFQHVFKLPIKFFASRKIGDITTRFQDAFTVKQVLTNTALTVFVDIILAIITAVIMAIMCLKMFLIMLTVVVLSVIVIYAFKGTYKRLNKTLMEKNARLNGDIIENLKGIETVKVNAIEDKTIDKIESDYVGVLKTSYRQGSVNNVHTLLSGIITGLGNLILMAVGVYFAINGEITIGTVLSFFTIAGYFTDPIGRLVEMQLSIQEASISLKRLSEIYGVNEEEADEDGLVEIEDVCDDIRIDNVSFAYGGRSAVLHNVSFTIPKGKKVAIVGESGCGKTTLSKLLLKFYLPQDGTIYYGGQDIKNINAFSLREKVGYVPQNIEMFSGSIAYNIRIGKEDATENEIFSVGEYCGCNEFVNRLPNTYETFLDETGGGLSGGEKQRLAMARAFIKRPDFVIMDEATSNLDFSTEARVFDTIFNKEKNTTMLIIAHRLSTIMHCDNIIVLDHGKVAEQGNHKELLEKKGIYYSMWMTQSGKSTVNKKQSVNNISEENEIEYK